MSQPAIEHYQELWFRPGTLCYCADPQTNFLLVITDSQKIQDGWRIIVTWIQPIPNITVKWRIRSLEITSSEYSDSLGGCFVGDRCEFDVPSVETLIFEYVFIAKT